MNEQEGDRIGIGRALMDSVNVSAFYGHHKLIETVELSFLCTPIESLAPISNKVAQCAQLGAVLPANSFELIGQAGAR